MKKTLFILVALFWVLSQSGYTQHVTLHWTCAKPLVWGNELEIVLTPESTVPISSIKYVYGGVLLEKIGNTGYLNVNAMPQNGRVDTLRFEIELFVELCNGIQFRQVEIIKIKPNIPNIELTYSLMALYARSCNEYRLDYNNQSRLGAVVMARGGLASFIAGDSTLMRIVPAGGPFELTFKEKRDGQMIEHDRWRIRVIQPPCPSLGFQGFENQNQDDTLSLSRNLWIWLRRDDIFQSHCMTDYYHFDSAHVHFTPLAGGTPWQGKIHAPEQDSMVRNNGLKTTLPAAVQSGVPYLLTIRAYGRLVNCLRSSSNVAYCNSYDNSNAECLVFHYIAVLKD